MFKGKDKKEVAVVTPEKPEICTKEKPSSGNGSTHGWKVQARVFNVSANRPKAYLQPHNPNPLILTTEWQTISFFKGNNPAGVPTCKGVGAAHMDEHGIMDRDAAIALAYTFVAQNDERYFPEIEIRIVPYKLEYSVKYWREGEPILLEQHLDFHSKNHRDVVHKGAEDLRGKEPKTE